MENGKLNKKIQPPLNHAQTNFQITAGTNHITKKINVLHYFKFTYGLYLGNVINLFALTFEISIIFHFLLDSDLFTHYATSNST